MAGEVLPDDVHWSMFVPNTMSTCSDAQQAHWLPRIETGEVIGCYAQTELSHGSNVRALRTTATFPISPLSLPYLSPISPVSLPYLSRISHLPGARAADDGHLPPLV